TSRSRIATRDFLICCARSSTSFPSTKAWKARKPSWRVGQRPRPRARSSSKDKEDLLPRKDNLARIHGTLHGSPGKAGARAQKKREQGEFSSQPFPPSPHKSTAFALHSGIDPGRAR